MRLIFAGTPPFAAIALQALIDGGHEIALVLTQPDRPAGRGLRHAPSAVKIIAQKQMLTIEQPLTLKTDAAAQTIIRAHADAMIVAAYGLILPKAILGIPQLGCINIHASLLPRWRGAAPIQRAILAGDAETGVTIMQMNEGLDTGDILASEPMAIGSDETAGELHDRLAVLGARMIKDMLHKRPAPTKQDDALATYAAKLRKEEAVIDWNEDAIAVHRQIRAFNPVPGAVTMFAGERIKIWHTSLVPEASGAPGTVCTSAPGQLLVTCGSGGVLITELQRAGGKRLTAAQFLAGFPIASGARFEPVAA